MRRSPGCLKKSSKEYCGVKKRDENMTSDPKEKEKMQSECQSERRGFLKKAVYAAPTLMIMGQLIRPTQSKAWGEVPPSQPQGE